MPIKKPIKVFTNAISVYINNNQCFIVTEDFQQIATSSVTNVQHFRKNGGLTIAVDTQNTRYTFINPKETNIA